MRGQVWSVDFILSVVIFVTMIILFFFTFNLLSADASQQEEINRMQDTALEVTEALVRTTGSPPGWTNATVQLIGLAERENVLNDTRVLRFVNQSLDYNISKILLGIGGYEYYVRIEHPNGSTVFLKGLNLTKGLNYTSAEDIVPVERYVLLNGLKRLVFILWR